MSTLQEGVICTHWEVDPEEGKCSEAAVIRQGIRCPNGCWGEGEFDYACGEHRGHLEDGGPWICEGCKKAYLEVFPIQVLQ